MDRQTEQYADSVETQLVDLSEVSLEQLRSRGNPVLAHSVRRVLAEADAPETLRAVGHNEGVIF